MTSSDVRGALLEEYLELKERVNPLEKRLSHVRDQLRDIVTEEGHFVDERRGVGVHVEARFRKEYDPDRLALAFPRLAGCIRPVVDTNQLEACVAAGMVTERELEREGVLFRTLHSRALVVKKIPRAHVAGSDAVRMNLAPSTHEGDERTALGRGKTDHLDIDSQVLPTVREDAARDLESWLASGG